MNSKKKGDIGLGAAIAHFTTKGNTVCIPLTDSQEYDLVVEMEKGLEKIQVKTTSQQEPSGNFSVGLRTMSGNKNCNKIKHFNPDKVDLLFVLTTSGHKYLIPSKVITAKSSIVLGKKYEKYRLSVSL